MLNILQRADYALRQGARIAWYTGHYVAIRRGQLASARKAGMKRPAKPLPGLPALMEDMGALFGDDFANAEEGIYPLPRDHDGSPAEILNLSRQFFRDLPSVERRRAERDGAEVFDERKDTTLPRYYQQNFHYQTDGYLSDHSARLYDFQVEILFSGAANAMRRQALVPVAHYLAGRDPKQVNLLDLACGTGRFLRFARRAQPSVKLTGLDLSQAYIAEARRHLRASAQIDLICANGENLPLDDASQDLVTAIFLFHELPPKIRRVIAREIARVLKPGGRFIFLDSLQFGDKPGYDGLLELFDAGFHEPYFATYVSEDFDRVFGDHDLRRVDTRNIFLSKVMVYEKPVR